MAQIRLGSDLLEVEFTPEELNRAMQLCDSGASQMYLQNLRVDVVRKLYLQQFTKPEEDVENHRVRAYLRGQLDLLDSLIDGILNPTQVPLQNNVSPMQEVFTSRNSQES